VADKLNIYPTLYVKENKEYIYSHSNLPTYHAKREHGFNSTKNTGYACKYQLNIHDFIRLGCLLLQTEHVLHTQLTSLQTENN